MALPRLPEPGGCLNPRKSSFSSEVRNRRSPTAGFPYYIGGEIKNRKSLLVAPKSLLEQRYQLKVHTNTEVLAIDRDAKVIKVRNVLTDELRDESYDKLILSPGAKPFIPPIPGADLPGVFTLRNLDDADRLLKQATYEAKHVMIVGGGFIGLELAENFHHRGLNSTIIELNDQLMPPLDREMTTPIRNELVDRGIQLQLNDSVVAIERRGEKLIAKLKSEQEHAVDFIVMCAGVRPENSLAVDANLNIGERGGIQVNSQMQTSDPDIYAVGDAIESYDFLTELPTQVPLAGPANRQGRLAANHIFGSNDEFRGIQGTAIVGLFGKSAAMTGMSEKAARRQSVPHQKVFIHPAHHAGYYPGAEGMTLKLIFDPRSGKVLGAQGVGGEGVDKRIDVISTAIQAGMTVFDLEEIELCYAPQFGSAKDPVNMLGFVASGFMRGEHPLVHVDELSDISNSNRILLDVRTPKEYEAGHIPSAINIPVDELRERIHELPADREIVCYCKVGMRGYLATRILIQHDRKAKNLTGGFTTWTMSQS